MDLHKKSQGKPDVAKNRVEEKKPSGSDERDFTIKSWKEDCCLIVEDRKLYVAKLVLGLASPVFERMFESEFKEKAEAEIPLPGKKFEDVQEFLRCIYPGVMKDITINNAHKIVPLAEEYQVATVKAKCEACLMVSVNKKIPAAGLCELLNLACRYSLQVLFQKCIELAAEWTLGELYKAEGKTPLPLEAKCAIQRQMITNLEKKQSETSLMVDNLMVDLQRAVTLSNYHRAYTPMDERLNYDDFVGWRGISRFMQIDAKTKSTSFSAELCGTEIEIVFQITNDWFCLILIFSTDSRFHLAGNVVIENGLKGKSNSCKAINQHLYNRRSVTEIIERYYILNEKEGYVFHGKIGVEVHILAKKI